jgi:retron-type reverse transcriptase
MTVLPFATQIKNGCATIKRDCALEVEVTLCVRGVASPLLANIALHGMEEALGIKYRKDCSQIIGGRVLVRYADDFVIFCETRGDAETAQETIGTWLGDRGLTLSEEKTRIVHLNEGELALEI